MICGRSRHSGQLTDARFSSELTGFISCHYCLFSRSIFIHKWLPANWLHLKSASKVASHLRMLQEVQRCQRTRVRWWRMRSRWKRLGKWTPARPCINSYLSKMNLQYRMGRKLAYGRRCCRNQASQRCLLRVLRHSRVKSMKAPRVMSGGRLMELN